MLKTRIITAVFLLGGLLGALFFLPPDAWAAFCALICALAAWEWGGLVKWGQRGRVAYAVLLGGVAFLLGLTMTRGVAYDLLLRWWVEIADVEFVLFVLLSLLFLLASAFWLLVVPFWLRYKWALRAWVAPLVGFVVLMPPVLVLVVLRSQEEPWVVLGIAAIVWIADIAAYFSGRAFGGKKLAPNISPGKTWAGAIGAVIGVMVYGNVMLLLMGAPLDKTLWCQPMLAGLAGFSIVGDLFESLLKRQAGVKDSSNLLPGHGGILDRIDSLTSTLSLVGLGGVVLFMFMSVTRH